jgi:hypothetical protein
VLPLLNLFSTLLKRRSRRRCFKPGAGGFKILARTFCSGLAAQPSRVTTEHALHIHAPVASDGVHGLD